MKMVKIIVSSPRKSFHGASTSSRLDAIPDVSDSDIWESQFTNDFQSNRPRSQSSWCRPSYIPITLILVLIFLVVLLPLLDHSESKLEAALRKKRVTCSKQCRLNLVESIPEGLNYSDVGIDYISTYDTWKHLINISTTSIKIASFYWTLRSSDVSPHPSSYQGEDIFNDILTAGLYKNISVTIAQDMPSEFQPNPDTDYLRKVGAASVKSLDFNKLMGGGVLHTKFWIVDDKHLYIGSANMDWRSLTQVKELGAVVYDCPCLADDLNKIFKVYVQLDGKDSVPAEWPVSLATSYSMKTPMNVTFNDTSASVFISSSPPQFSPRGRTNDIDAILNIINKAEKFIYIAVMDYFPLMIYSKHLKYWSVIDDALRAAVVDRSVNLCLLISHWNHSRPMMINFLKSLLQLDDFNKNASVQVKLFIVPSNSSQASIPFARVNHNKYMVTDKVTYIGTSNWSGDYFVNTAGVGLIISDEVSIRYRLQEIFERDWYSQYAHDLMP